MQHYRIAVAAMMAAVAVTANAAPDTSMKDVKAIKDLLNQTCVDMNNNKIDGTTWYFQKDILVYDLVPPLISDAETVKEGNRHWHAIIDGKPDCRYEDVHVRMLGRDYAFSGSIIYLGAKLKAGGELAIRMRSTDIWERTKNGWRAIHEHTSVPFDAKTGQPQFMLPINKPKG